MEAREQRGLVIAATTKLSKDQGVWTVPSQTIPTVRYTVLVLDNHAECDCPDFVDRHLPCKHIYAVQYTIQRETTREEHTDADGVTTVTHTETVTETVR